VTGHKTCRTCEQTKPVSDFQHHQCTDDGLKYDCRACVIDRNRASDTPRRTRKRADLPRPDWGWQNNAKCRGEDLVLFFGPEGERQPERETREEKAKQVCQGCPVRTACLDYAVSRPEKHGLYGGLNEDERAAERRRRLRRAS
jgi:WhiB family transcriptional regulator, redox-sensing transcriptional regulator